MSAMTRTTAARRIGRAEWTKLRSSPSTWRTAVITVAMAIGFGVAAGIPQRRLTFASIARLAFPVSLDTGRTLNLAANFPR